jgi:hypothetical protein
MHQLKFATARSCGIFVLAMFSIINVKGQALTGGTISNATQTINYNTAPAQLNASVATGGTCGGAYSYQWQKSSTIGGTYTDIAGATTQNYQPPVLIATTYYKRKVTCAATTAFTNIATVNVAAVLYGGYVTNPNQTIAPNTVPAQINATLPTGGNCGTGYTYQWQSQPFGGSVANIPGATSQNYQPGALTVTTYFYRTTTCNGQTAVLETSGTVTVISPLNGGCITSTDQTITAGSIPATILAAAATNGNCGSSYSYQWQSSPDNIYFYNIAGATSQNLSFSATLPQTTWFQRKTTCGSEVKYTNSVKVTVN